MEDVFDRFASATNQHPQSPSPDKPGPRKGALARAAAAIEGEQGGWVQAHSTRCLQDAIGDIGGMSLALMLLAPRKVETQVVMSPSSPEGTLPRQFSPEMTTMLLACFDRVRFGGFGRLKRRIGRLKRRIGRLKRRVLTACAVDPRSRISPPPHCIVQVPALSIVLTSQYAVLTAQNPCRSPRSVLY